MQYVTVSTPEVRIIEFVFKCYKALSRQSLQTADPRLDAARRLIL